MASRKVIKVKCDGTQYVDFHELHEFQEDIKQSTKEDLEKLKAEIKKAFKLPFAIWKYRGKWWICDGHQRKKALTELEQEGWNIPQLPAIEIKAATKKEAKENVLLFISQTGEVDREKLKLYIQKYDIQLQNIVIRTEPLKIELTTESKETKDDDVIPEEIKLISKLGDLWELGNHRVLCGDSRKEINIKKLCKSKKVDMGFNDPPYGMKKENDGVLNDNLNQKKLLEFNKIWIKIQFEILKDNGSLYVWGCDESIMNIYQFVKEQYINKQLATFRNIITWDKGNGQGQNSDNTRMYAIADEKCIFFMCGVQGFNNNADNYFEGWEPVRDYLLKSRKAMGWDIPTMKKIVGHSDLSRDHWTSKSQFNFPTEKVYNSLRDEAERQRKRNAENSDAFKKEYDELKKEYDAFKKEYDELKKEYYSTRAYFDNIHDNFNNVWHFKRENEKIDHATPKPVVLCERAIKSSCEENGIVIDFFLGSGSTLIACEKTNRICYGMELEPHYVDVLVTRWVEWMRKNNRPIEIKLNGKPFNVNRLNNG